MCTEACLRFGRENLSRAEVEGKTVLEVGSRQVQGPEMSLRPVVEALGPKRYVGVDLYPGPGVDEICPVENLVRRFGRSSFDLVVSTEMLEHVRHWRPAVTNLKLVTREVLLVTTRSKGFPHHGWPQDYWRYEIDDMKVLFGDLAIEVLEPDREFPGVFLKARKPSGFIPRDLADHRLFSVIKQRRVLDVSDRDERIFRVLYGPVRLGRALAPRSLKRLVKRTPLSRERRALTRVR
jgi:hypothetical protein